MIKQHITYLGPRHPHSS